MKHRISYEVDPHNRLIIKKTGGRSNVRKFRQVVSGRFKTDNKNKLYYEVYKPLPADIPQKIKFSGKYYLDSKHNLIFTLDKWANQYAGNRLRLKTGIAHAGSSEIVLLLNSRTSKKKRSIYLMTLHGAWQADKNNRLTFGVKKESDKSDDLTLFNAWKIGKNSEITYSQGKNYDVVGLKGFWDIRKKRRLSYILDKKIGSALDFKATLGRIIPKKKKTYVKFDVTIDISKKKRVRRNVGFSGTWKLSRDKNILLEISPGKRKTLALKLTKSILDSKGRAYIESFVRNRERYLGAGIGFGW
ncbi:MAG: hypothetical protein KJ706_08780 [Candidatus Omnitrophica bacterium]|nr:hypothetical protein [Candidatus Omnitrophota bacterium]MBU4590132.1 hypothetical protein [Candidatus Omnitrophota bacterium]